MNRTLSNLRISRLLTLITLVGTLGLLALFAMAFVMRWPAVTRRISLGFGVAMLLVSGGITTLLGARLMAMLRARRDSPTSSDAPRVDLAAPARFSRRDFLRFFAVEAVLGGATVAAIGYVGRIEPNWLRVEEVEVPIVDLPPQLDGLCIVQLSDLHLSRIVPLEHIQRAVATAQELAGDLIVLTGDYVTRRGDDALACARALSELHAPLGVYAVLGNRDHKAGVDRVADAFSAAGLNLLRNQGVPIARDGGGQADFWLAGLDDVRARADDLEATLDGAPGDLPVILLVHEPDYACRIADRAADLGVVLQVSGHSHGGQVRLPFVGALVLPRLGQEYPLGLQKAGQMWVYTNRGVGMTSPPIRFNCPPEVTALTLRRA
jgi:predicted MPP superfamily phosphohydrolase